MALGKTVTQANVNEQAVNYSRRFTELLNDEGFTEWGNSILAMSDASLVALGFVQAEVDTLKAFINQANTLIAAYNAANACRFYARQIYKTY